MIKFRLVPFEKACVFQVLEMDKAQTNKTRGRGVPPPRLFYKASNGFEVISGGGPGLDGERHRVFLRGAETTFDKGVRLRNFVSNTERDEYMHDLEFALEEWVRRGGFFPENKKSEVLYKSYPTGDGYTKEF